MASDGPLVLCDRTVDLDRGHVRVRGDATDRLTTKERQLLAYLAARPGQVVSRDELLEHVWGYRPHTVTRAVEQMMRKLRRKVEARPDDPVHLCTVFGEGYRFEPTRAGPVPVGAATNLPPLRPAPVGRGDLVQHVAALLADGAGCVTLVGPAGIGKTTAACLIGLHEAAHRTGGAWRCDVGGPLSPEALRQRVAWALGSTDAGVSVALAASGPMLLLLDEADALDAVAEDEIGAWLAANPRLAVVATSRTRCLPRLGTVVEVGPLDAAAAQQLLVQHARRSQPGIDEGTLEGLGPRLGGWPLAIELAAARLRVLTPHALGERLDGGWAVLGGARDAPSLQGLLAGAIDALPPSHREVLAACAVFRAPFTVADAEAVAGSAALEAIHDLVDHSLIASRRGGRLHLLDAVRGTVLQGLDPEARARLAERHAQHAVAIAGRVRQAPVSSGWADVRAAFDDLLAAFAYLRPAAPDQAARVAMVVQMELALRGHQALRQQVLREAREAGPSEPLDVALRRATLLAEGLGGRTVADDELVQLVADADRIGDADLSASCRLARAQFLRRAGRLADAAHVAAQASDAIVPGGDPFVGCWAALVRGGVCMDAGQADAARDAYRQALEQGIACGDRGMEGQASWSLGMLESLVGGRQGAAEAHLRHALDRAGDEPRVPMDAQIVLGQVAAARGDVEEARRVRDAVAGAVLRFGEVERMASLNELTAEIHAMDGDWDGAEALLLQNQALYERIGSAYRHLMLINLAVVHRLGGKPRLALDVLREALRGCEASAPRLVGSARVELVAALAELGEVDAARATWSEVTTEGPREDLARGHLLLAEGDRAGATRVRDALAALPERSLGLQCGLRHLTHALVRAPEG